jgi:HD-GYP domain-containing protein (c-di-GMP phosphodiesterase class II)
MSSFRQSGTSIFLLSAAALSFTALIPCVFFMEAVSMHVHPLWPRVLLGLLISLLLSGLMAARFSSRVVRLKRMLVRGISSGSVQDAEEQVRALRYSLCADIAEAWLATATALQHAYHQKQMQAAQQMQVTAELMRMFAKAVDERTPYLRGHSERVAAYAGQIAREMKLPAHEIERIRLAALLHDIGSLGIDDQIMTKESTLTVEEFDSVKAHPLRGAAILRPIEPLHDLIPGVEFHHEALDGSGYPYGVRAEEIPLMARIVAVADSFDAMTTWRPYQAPMDPLYTVEVMQRLAGKRYDAQVVAALHALLQRGAIVVPVTRPVLDQDPPRRLRLVR